MVSGACVVISIYGSTGASFCYPSYVFIYIQALNFIRRRSHYARQQLKVIMLMIFT